MPKADPDGWQQVSPMTWHKAYMQADQVSAEINTFLRNRPTLKIVETTVCPKCVGATDGQADKALILKTKKC